MLCGHGLVWLAGIQVRGVSKQAFSWSEAVKPPLQASEPEILESLFQPACPGPRPLLWHVASDRLRVELGTRA